MFLDIDMDERSGMDIARRVRELHLDTIIIFVTNYPEFSMEGYEVRAFRYLLKQEMQQKLPLYFRDALAEIPHDKKELRFSVNAEPYRVAYKDILYLESQQRIVVLHTENPLQGGDRFYGNLLRKYSVINGVFDDDLYQEQCMIFVHCIEIFEVK